MRELLQDGGHQTEAVGESHAAGERHNHSQMLRTVEETCLGSSLDAQACLSANVEKGATREREEAAR